MAALLGGVMLHGATAEANGRYPRAEFLAVGPGRSDELFALRTTFGLVVSDDGGQRFRFVCEEAYQIPDGYDPTVAWTRRGALLVGTPTGLLSTGDLCDPIRRGEFEGQEVVDLAGDGLGNTLLAAVQSRDAVPVVRVAWTSDGGGAWTLPPAGFEGEVALTVEVAPSDPRRGYLTTAAWVGDASTLRRSDDGGATWRASPARFGGRPFLAGVDPLRPAVLFVRVEQGPARDGGSLVGGTALLRSDDGGDTFREVGRTRGAMLGFALSDDGRHVWIGGPSDDDGVARSDDGGPFVRIHSAGVDCLRWHAGALYACETLGGRMGAALLSRSLDLGASRAVIARMDGVLPPPARCPQGSIVRGFCAERWPAVRSFVLGQTRGDAGAPEAPPPRDAGVDGGGGSGGGGDCDCRATPSRGDRSGPYGLMFAALGRRRRRR